LSRIIKCTQTFTTNPENNFLLGNHPKIKNRYRKDIARNELINFILSEKENLGNIKALTLPGVWWRFERELQFRYKKKYCSFISFEKNLRLFNMSAMRIPKKNKPLKMKYSQECKSHVISNGSGYLLIHGNIYDYLISPNLKNQKYNLIWIDAENPINEKLIFALKSLKEYLQDKAIIVLTVLGAREALAITYKMQRDRIGFLKYEIPKMFNVKHTYLTRYNDGSPMIQCIYSNLS